MTDSVDGEGTRARAPRTILLLGEVDEGDDFFSRFEDTPVPAPLPLLVFVPALVLAPVLVPATLVSLLRPRDRDRCCCCCCDGDCGEGLRLRSFIPPPVPTPAPAPVPRVPFDDDDDEEPLPCNGFAVCTRVGNAPGLRLARFAPGPGLAVIGGRVM